MGFDSPRRALIAFQRSLPSLLDSLLVGLLFAATWRWPAASGWGWHEVAGAGIVPVLLLRMAIQGRHFGWIFGGLFLGLGLVFTWVPATLESKGPVPYPVALGGTLLLCAWEALGPALLVFWTGRIHRVLGSWPASLLAGAGILAWELLGYHIYPWTWGSAFGALPALARAAAFLGAFGLSAWTWACAVHLAGGKHRLPGRLRVAGIWLGVPLLLGMAWHLLPAGRSLALDVAVVQPNFEAGTRHSGMEEDHWRRTDALLTANGLPRKERRTLVLWAESSVLGRDDSGADPRLTEEARRRGVAWLFGTEGRRPGGDFLGYNLVRGEVEGRPCFLQAKVELMPFGERMPGPAPLRESLDRSLGFLSQTPGELAPSSSFALPTPQGELRIHPLVCSEALLPQRMTRGLTLAGGDLLTNHTNDGWFERSVATDIHAAQLRLRAVEAGVPLVRATLSGKSGLFREDGRFELWGEARSEGAWAIPLDWRPRRTLARWTGLPWTLLTLLVGGSLFLARIRSRA